MKQETRRKVRNPEKDARGFSLLEVMFTMVIILVGLLGLQMMTLMAIRGTQMSKEITTASNLSQDLLEQIRAMEYHNVIDASFAEESIGFLPGRPKFQRTVSILEGTPEPNSKTVTVTVSWMENGRTRSSFLSTVVADGEPEAP